MEAFEGINTRVKTGDREVSFYMPARLIPGDIIDLSLGDAPERFTVLSTSWKQDFDFGDKETNYWVLRAELEAK